MFVTKKKKTANVGKAVEEEEPYIGWRQGSRMEPCIYPQVPQCSLIFTGEVPVLLPYYRSGNKLRDVKHFPKIMKPACRKKALLEDVGKPHGACFTSHLQ